MVIGVMGYKGSGKDEVAKALIKHKFRRFAFGDPLKDMLIEAGLLTYEEAYITKPPRARELFQKIGTNIIRNQVDVNFWCKKTYCQIMDYLISHGSERDVVVSDVRFRNEAEIVTSGFKGKLVKVMRPEILLEDDHESETEFRTISYDYAIVNDVDLQAVEHKVESMLEFFSWKTK